MKKRTRARELALQLLYMIDQRGVEMRDDKEIDGFLREEERDVTTREFATLLVRGTTESREPLDSVIRSVAQNWDIDRMAVIDRNVLRMAAFELLHCDDIPPKVSINEAIELGKRFSTENSGGFINGILDKIKDQHVDATESGATKTDSGEAAPSEPVGETDPAAGPAAGSDAPSDSPVHGAPQ